MVNCLWDSIFIIFLANDQHHSEPPEAVIECVLWFEFFTKVMVYNFVATTRHLLHQ